MILYIHGFASNGLSTKANLFREHYRGKEEFLAPSLSYIPDLALATLEELVVGLCQQGSLSLIGSSLGGFYAMYLSQKYHVPAVLINPAANPVELSKSFEGDVKSYYDGTSFQWQRCHTEALAGIKDRMEPTFENCLAFIKKGDELVSYVDSVDHIPSAEIVLEEGGDHAFNDILTHAEKIAIFFETHTVSFDFQ